MPGTLGGELGAARCGKRASPTASPKRTVPLKIFRNPRIRVSLFFTSRRAQSVFPYFKAAKREFPLCCRGDEGETTPSLAVPGSAQARHRQESGDGNAISLEPTSQRLWIEGTVILVGAAGLGLAPPPERGTGQAGRLASVQCGLKRVFGHAR